MKTIKQIAMEIGVSKQAVHQKIKKEPLSTSLQSFMSTVDGTVYISVDGETLIKSAFNKIEPSTVDTTSSMKSSTVDSFIDSSIDGSNDQIIMLLKENLHLLQGQLAEKDKQIENLSAALVFAQQTASAAQALHAGTIQKQLTNNVNCSQIKEEVDIEKNPVNPYTDWINCKDFNPDKLTPKYNNTEVPDVGIPKILRWMLKRQNKKS